jgi:dipeptidyl aminopeptidase/acylaminoacyl peptidase
MVYLSTPDKNGRTALWTLDTASMTQTLVDATANPSAGVLERDDRLIGYATTDGSWKYLDPAWQHDYDVVRRAIPKMTVELVDRSKDGVKTLISAAEPHGPKSWWILDRRTKPAQLSIVVSTYEAVADAGIAPVRKVTYTARDGLAIDAWLTLPKSAGGGPVPFVVLPHGGPFVCENGDFDFIAQFLASRGYGVLQPQFRGSTCNGAEFERLGFRQWGLAMQDDLTDGTRWLIQQKLADAARICIVGASYGGYAALEGVVKEPDLYRCAAAWAPATDLAKMVSKDKRDHLNTEAGIDTIGTDHDALKDVSPALHADRIRVPVLLVHGKSDFTVQVWQSEEMEEALKDAHKNVEAIYLDDSDHYMDTFDARLAWLKALEKFLATNLGPAKS